jgi:hypothetical protein
MQPKNLYKQAGALLFFGTALALAACASQAVQPTPSLSGNAIALSRGAAHLLSSPTEVLYVLVGKTKSRTPSVAAFDGNDSSSDPKPLYTIRPNGIGSYGYLAVDDADNLFVAKYLAQSTKIYMFAAGQVKASAVCNLPYSVSSMTIADGTLYAALGDGTDRIQEFKEPFTGGTCAEPTKTLTDEIAVREGGKYLWGVSIDPAGSIFDIYEGGPGIESMYMDEFTAGTDHSHAFLKLGESYSTFYMTIDKHKNIILGYENQASDSNAYLAVFPHETKKPALYYPLGNGAWLGVGLAKDQTELFALSDYPTTKISVYAYNASTGKIGELKRTIGGLWMYDQQFAIYSKS